MVISFEKYIKEELQKKSDSAQRNSPTTTDITFKDSECDLWWPGRSFRLWRLLGWGRPCPGCRSCRSSGPLQRTCPAPSPWRSLGGLGTCPSGPPFVCPSPCPVSTPCGRSHTAAPPSTQQGRSHCSLPPPHCCCCRTELTLEDREDVKSFTLSFTNTLWTEMHRYKQHIRAVFLCHTRIKCPHPVCS